MKTIGIEITDKCKVINHTFMAWLTGLVLILFTNIGNLTRGSSYVLKISRRRYDVWLKILYGDVKSYIVWII